MLGENLKLRDVHSMGKKLHVGYKTKSIMFYIRHPGGSPHPKEIERNLKSYPQHLHVSHTFTCIIRDLHS